MKKKIAMVLGVMLVAVLMTVPVFSSRVGAEGEGGGGNNSSANSTGSTKQGGGDAKDEIRKECETASTSILGNGGCVSDDGKGSSIYTVLNIILQILTWGIGIAGTFGIVISGIQYMTARDDPAQMTKAKNRIIHIAIGLVAYAVMWAFLQWLLPGGILNGQ